MNVLRTRHRVMVATAMYALIACSAGAADMNGPMSSTKKSDATAPSATETAPAADSNAAFDVEKLFAGTCGWCHSGGGREAGKGPKLMGTTLTDEEITRRIMLGKPGAMPAFA